MPGAGLGLSLSRRLALLMQGEVSAESAVGVGSCFRLDMPFDPGRPDRRPGAVPELPADALARAKIGPCAY